MARSRKKLEIIDSIDPKIINIAVNRSFDLYKTTIRLNDYRLLPGIAAVYLQGLTDGFSIEKKDKQQFENGAGI